MREPRRRTAYLPGVGRYSPCTAFDGDLRLSQGFPSRWAVLWVAPQAVAAIIAKLPALA
ncbi:MAG: hypothetical protein OXU61_05210 [Gammaproteobacteria bacterium]|nr:hypothetical protein [Gammaproteobacteria bacterium]